jgi:nicotinate phosphoribosyltransferase
MANALFSEGDYNKIAYFDLYFRSIPENGGFAITAGLAQVIERLETFQFSTEDIEFLRSKEMFTDSFLAYLAEFKLECDIWAISEGTPVFPNEPLIIVRGPMIQAQILETILLLHVNHQSLIATKANKMVRAAEGRTVFEFGARRAHGESSALYGARAAFIGGCSGTSCVEAEKAFGIPSFGTMAHSWVQFFDDEYLAFSKYADKYPDSCSLLLDTYNVLESGIYNAIKIHKDILVPRGHRLKSVRIDSGDITYLSKKIRVLLDNNELNDCKIIASNALDEGIIKECVSDGAKIDIFGVGERLITAYPQPVFGCVYKLVAVENDGRIIPKMKISENIGKITTPGFKNVFRLFSNDDGMAVADIVTLHDEKIACPYKIFNPNYTWKKKIMSNFTAEQLLIKIFSKGKRVYDSPSVEEIQKSCTAQVAHLWDEIQRFNNPHEYYVDLSENLWELRRSMLRQERE